MIIEPWMQAAGGGPVDLLDPQVDQIDLHDITHHLSKLARWTGAVKGDHHYSVAEHSCVVMWIGLELQRTLRCYSHMLAAHLLLHDAHEAYTGDISSPMGTALDRLAGKPIVATIKARLQSAIEQRLGLPAPTTDELRIIRQADAMALRLERDQLLTPSRRTWSWEPPQPPVAIKLACWSAMRARRSFEQALWNYGIRNTELSP